MWLALYDRTHARSHSSTIREVLLQHSSIVNTRCSSSSTLMYYICSQSASASLQTVDAPRRSEKCTDSTRCFIATRRRARAAHMTGDNDSRASRAQIGMIVVSHSAQLSQLSTRSTQVWAGSQLRLEVCKLRLHLARSAMLIVLCSYLVIEIRPVTVSVCQQLYI